MTTEAPTSASRIGATIRALRRERRLTLVQLALLAELSHPFLSQVERGLASPSIGSLERIARALGSSQLEIMSHASEEQAGVRGAHVVRSGEGRRGPYGLGEARMLAHGDTRFLPMDFVADNAELGDYLAHEEDEFLTVISGSVLVDLAEAGEHSLGAGDSIYYPGGTLHRWRSLDGGQYRMVVVKDRLGGGMRPTRRRASVTRSEDS